MYDVGLYYANNLDNKNPIGLGAYSINDVWKSEKLNRPSKTRQIRLCFVF